MFKDEIYNPIYIYQLVKIPKDLNMMAFLIASW